MSDSLCGPSNAVKRFGEHADRDRSAHQDRVVSAAQTSAPFRSTAQGNTVVGDLAYNNFQAGDRQLGLPLGNIGPGVGFAPPIHGPFDGITNSQSHVLPHPHQVTHAPKAWAEEYSTMAAHTTNGHLNVAPNSQHTVLPGVASPGFHLNSARPWNSPFAGPTLANGVGPQYLGGALAYQSAPTAAALAVPAAAQTATIPQAPQFTDDEMEAAFRQYDDHRGDDAEFEREMAAWMAKHGPSQQTNTDERERGLEEVDERLAALTDHLEQADVLEQKLDHRSDAEREEEERQKEQLKANEELRRTAEEINQTLGGQPKFQDSRFLELMRSIMRGDVTLDPSQTDLVDAVTQEPVSGTRSGTPADYREDSIHPPVSGIPGGSGRASANELRQDKPAENPTSSH